MTDDELDKLKKLMQVVVTNALEDKVPELVRKEMSYLPTKDEFYEKMDEVVGELKKIREEQTLMSNTLSEHTDQIEKMDKRVKKTERALNLS